MITILCAIGFAAAWFCVMLGFDYWYRDRVRGWNDSIIGDRIRSRWGLRGYRAQLRKK